jgi:hypothetical protein
VTSEEFLMMKPESHPNHAFAMMIGLCLAVAAPGCGGNPNEAEYLRTAPPGKQAEPESVASRRERTKVVPSAPAKGKQKAG